jgi:hypothetical protein
VAALLAAFLMAACSVASPSVDGRIYDDRIEVDDQTVPGNAWLSLTNLGSRPCRLVLLDTLDERDANVDPRRLPVAAGRVVVRTTDPSAPGIQVSEELYAEVDGRAVAADTSEGFPAVMIEPGVTARVQLALIGTPRNGAVRVLVCHDPGDYDLGRYAVIPFR